MRTCTAAPAAAGIGRTAVTVLCAGGAAAQSRQGSSSSGRARTAATCATLPCERMALEAEVEVQSERHLPLTILSTLASRRPILRLEYPQTSHG